MVYSRSQAATECEVLQASSCNPQWARATDLIPGRARPAKLCGFAAALGRRGRVVHNPTGRTSV